MSKESKVIPNTISPSFLIECIKLAYKLDYAREVAGKMINAAYPEASERDLGFMRRHILDGFSFDSYSADIELWTMEDIAEFLKYHEYIASVTHYMAVNDALKKVAIRFVELKPEKIYPIESWMPLWYFNTYVHRLY